MASDGPRSKADAVQDVAKYLTGCLEGVSAAVLYGADARLTPAQNARIADACGDISVRLSKLGGRKNQETAED